MENNRNDGHHARPKLQIQPNLGLDSEARSAIIELLIPTLADEAVLTAKTRTALWNERGNLLSGSQMVLETQYQLLNSNTNEIAERVRVLGGFAIGCFTDFLHHTRLVEHPGNVPKTLQLLADHETVTRSLREDIRKCAEEYEDAGTTNLLVGIIVTHEKMAWVLRSEIENNPLTSADKDQA